MWLLFTGRWYLLLLVVLRLELQILEILLRSLRIELRKLKLYNYWVEMFRKNIG